MLIKGINIFAETIWKEEWILRNTTELFPQIFYVHGKSILTLEDVDWLFLRFD